MPNKTDRDKFIEENLPLVHSLCRRFTGKGIEYDDLFSTGCVGLVKAADNFNGDLGLKFSTYAVPVILGELRRLFRDGGSIKISRSVKEVYLKAVREKEILSKALMREPTVSEIAEKIGATPEQVSEAVAAVRPTVSLSVGENGEMKEFDLPQNDSSESLLNRITVLDAINKLSDDEKKIINLRYYKFLTQNETASLLNMTQVQVSRKEKKILLKMKGIIGNVS